MDNRLIAYQGTVEILNAQWSLDAGRTVELRLTGDAFDRVHPFKRFQRRRNGRMGTRFQAAFSRTDTGDQVLVMETMLAAWKDSSSVGQSITLWLDNEVETHPFCGCTRRKASESGDVFALVLVELNDDDSPVDQHQRGDHADGAGAAPADAEGAEVPQHTSANPFHARRGGSDRAGPAKAKGAAPRKFSSSVHLLVTSPRYVQWLRETKGALVKEWTPELAKRYTKKVIEVESLSDLDRDQRAVKRYHEHIARPYARWAHQEP